MKITRIGARPDGVSYLEEFEPPLDSHVSASHGSTSADLPAKALGFPLVGIDDTEFEVDFHPSPRRQWIVVLSGEMDLTCADGSSMTVGPGSVFLVEDIQGIGHAARIRGPLLTLRVTPTASFSA